MSKRIGILTSGGDCGGLNAAIRAVALRAHHGYGWTTVGVRYGTLGLLKRPVDAIASSSKSLAEAADHFGRVTLPRLNHAADETARAARRLGRTASGISDNPQALLYGPGRAAAGPGEPGFVAPPVQP